MMVMILSLIKSMCVNKIKHFYCIDGLENSGLPKDTGPIDGNGTISDGTL